MNFGLHDQSSIPKKFKVKKRVNNDIMEHLKLNELNIFGNANEKRSKIQEFK